jgi:hypothetical protein
MTTKTIDPFFNIADKGLPTSTEIQSLSALQQLSAGYGSKSFKADQQGIWLGADKYADAPFKISMDGVVYIKATSGGYIMIDGVNQRIVVNDGADDRVLIGNLG